MKVQKRKRNISQSPEHSHWPVSQNGPSTSSPDSQALKKRKKQKSNALVLLSNVKLKRQMSRKKNKKMLKRARQALSQPSNWHSSPVKSPSEESSSSCDNFNSSSSLNNISEIYKNHADECFTYKCGDQSKNFSQQDFDAMVEDANYMSDVDSDDSSNSFYFKQVKGELTAKMKHSKKNVNFTDIPAKNAKIVVMDHPASVTLNGYVSVKVLSGSVSVYGHELKFEDIPIRVFSSHKTGLVQLTTESFDHLWKRKETFMSLHSRLMKLTGSLQKTRDILSQFGSKAVAIVVSNSVMPSNLQFLKLYYPSLFKFYTAYSSPVSSKPIAKFPTKVFSSSSQKYTLNFGHQIEDLASDINASIRTSKLKDSEGPRVLVYGSQNTGKSSHLRYLMNKALTMFPVVYYLDADPGQTEFTPPGVVSLTAVKQPVFGPPFTHQRKSVSMRFVGSLSAGSSPDMYSKCVEKLILLYEQKFMKEPLFVNTMGWVQGIGLECLKNIMKAVMPSVLIEMSSPDDEFMFDYREYCTPKVQFFQFAIARRYQPDMSSRDCREQSLLSYFGKCQLLHERPTYFTNLKPYCISWDKIPVYKFGSKLPPYRIIESLNASLVALCRVDESLILESSNPMYPITLEDEPDNRCIGFGIVRAIDEAKHLLYIVSPLSFDEIKYVNAIMRGSITVPNILFTKQPITGVSLPFTKIKSSKPVNSRDVPLPIADMKNGNELLSDSELQSEDESEAQNIFEMMDFNQQIGVNKKTKYL